MARSNAEIAAIIAELKTNREASNTAIESAATALDSSDSVNAARLRACKHIKEIENDIKLCIKCKIKKDSEGNVIGIAHIRYRIDDRIMRFGDGGSETQTIEGLNTMLADESVTITGATTVENL